MSSGKTLTRLHSTITNFGSQDRLDGLSEGSSSLRLLLLYFSLFFLNLIVNDSRLIYDP